MTRLLDHLEYLLRATIKLQKASLSNTKGLPDAYYAGRVEALEEIVEMLKTTIQKAKP